MAGAWPRFPASAACRMAAAIAFMPFSLAVSQAEDPAIRKRTAQVNDIHFRDTLCTLR
jgi:hypothetical protein